MLYRLLNLKTVPNPNSHSSMSTEIDQDTINEFIRWAKLKGALIDPRLSFKFTNESGITAIYNKQQQSTTEPLIIQIPTQLIIKLDDAYTKLKITNNDGSGGQPDCVTIMKFYVSYLKCADDGEFGLYFKLLPSLRKIGSPLTFSPEEMELLNGSNLYTGVKLKLKNLLNEYLNTLPTLDLKPSKRYESLSDTELFNTIQEEIKDTKTWYSFGWFLWSHLILTSRAFPYRFINSNADKKSVMLLPIIDLLNHEPKSKVSWFGSNDGFEITLDQSIPTVSTADTTSEVFNNYGPKGNEELFMGYGFCIPDNEFENLHLSLNVAGLIPILEQQFNKSENEWSIKLPKLSDYTYAIDDSRKDSTVETNKETDLERIAELRDDPNVIYLCNKHHLIPDGLLELYSFLGRNNMNDNSNTLKSKFTGLNNLKNALEVKFKGKLDKITTLNTEELKHYTITDPEFIIQFNRNYNNVKIYKNSQLNILNLIKSEIKSSEKKLLKLYRKKLITIKDILKKDEEFDVFIEIYQLPEDPKEMSKFQMEMLIHLWLLKTINYPEDDSNTLDISWIKEEFYRTYESFTDDPNESSELADLYEQMIPPLLESAPEEITAGNYWDLKSFLVLDQVYRYNSYEKGSNLEPILIMPTSL